MRPRHSAARWELFQAIFGVSGGAAGGVCLCLGVAEG